MTWLTCHVTLLERCVSRKMIGMTLLYFFPFHFLEKWIFFFKRSLSPYATGTNETNIYLTGQFKSWFLWKHKPWLPVSKDCEAGSASKKEVKTTFWLIRFSDFDNSSYCSSSEFIFIIQTHFFSVSHLSVYHNQCRRKPQVARNESYWVLTDGRDLCILTLFSFHMGIIVRLKFMIN